MNVAVDTLTLTGEAIPDPDDAPLLDGSLGFSPEWAAIRTARRLAGGAPINFYRGRAKRALYADFTRTRDALDRDYRRDALDTSGLIEPVGAGWMSITEYGKAKGIGPRKARKIMQGLDLLQEEIEVRMVSMIVDPAQTKPKYMTTLRLAAWAVEAGFGRRIEPRHGHRFDMLSPDGVAWLDARWPKEEAREPTRRGRPTSNLREQVAALMADGKSQIEIARMLGKSKQSVCRQMTAIRAATVPFAR